VLEAGGIDPALDPKKIGATFYRRSAFNPSGSGSAAGQSRNPPSHVHYCTDKNTRLAIF
jgi:hypothetical protein